MNKPRTACFVLELIGMVALAACGVVKKYYPDKPKEDNNTTNETTDEVGGPFMYF